MNCNVEWRIARAVPRDLRAAGDVRKREEAFRIRPEPAHRAGRVMADRPELDLELRPFTRASWERRSVLSRNSYSRTWRRYRASLSADYFSSGPSARRIVPGCNDRSRNSSVGYPVTVFP